MDISGLTIAIGFALLTFGAFKEWNIICITIIAALIMGMGIPDKTLLQVLEQTWQGGFGSFASSWVVILCISAYFAKIMEDSGAAWRIGNTLITKFGRQGSLLMYVVVVTFLTYGGINCWTIIFVTLPIARPIFEKGMIPWYLFPGILNVAATFPLGIMPGALQIQNIIPTKYLGTNLMSGFWEGMAGTICFLAFNYLFFAYEIKKGRARGALDEKYGRPENTNGQDACLAKYEETAPNFWICLIPVCLSVILVNGFNINVIYAVAVGCLSAIALFRKALDNPVKTLNNGFMDGIVPVALVGSLIGFGKVVAITPAFASVKEWLFALPIGGAAKVVVIESVIAAITGSATGALTLALDMFAKDFLTWGLDPGTIHRLVVTASLGFDTTPWNAFAILTFSMAAVPMSKGFWYVFVASVIAPLLACIPIYWVGVLIH